MEKYNVLPCIIQRLMSTSTAMVPIASADMLFCARVYADDKQCYDIDEDAIQDYSNTDVGVMTQVLHAYFIHFSVYT
jgi:vesicle coat complex subunit